MLSAKQYVSRLACLRTPTWQSYLRYEKGWRAEGLRLRQGIVSHCQEVAIQSTRLYLYFVWRNSSLLARYARGKPHPRPKAFGTSAGFSITHG